MILALKWFGKVKNFRRFMSFFFYRETFQNVRETAGKLEMMNKKMVDLSKAGEATEALEQYVSIIWTGLNYLIQV